MESENYDATSFVCTFAVFFCGCERYTNSVLIPFAFVGCIQFRQLFQKPVSKLNSRYLEFTLSSLTVLLLPVLFHSSLLYYTDLLSLTTLLWATSLQPSVLSSSIFAVSIFTRQTNIIWAAVYGLTHLFILFKKQSNGAFSIMVLIKSLLHFWSLLLLPFGFIIFFLWNGNSIVLGDRLAHQPVAHFMQVCYFLIFLCFSSAPLLAFSAKTYQCLVYIIRKPFKLLTSSLLFTCCVYLFTLQHPYLLADNRHFTFYIWKRWFLRHQYCKYVTIILYIMALELVSQMMEHIPKALTLLYVLGTAAVLVPAYLLEPRYFIIPYIFWRLSYPERRIPVIILELIYEFLINAVVLYMFLYRPFEWVHEPGVKQRFMW
ncbi:alpha-1,2 glucosyltransferase [Loa loa]|uniref:Dol-P-Glc:Glc(2)Man(9)GlcNAc(2)-PP-Dol alpha-1,2-glucosyltransferase n=1 Tax=Loa loa TaxID=7209 RepID=A0A1S0TQ56_LOALO|nr:alpha-1,2 glucosyltransferase [Loa loa]EFO18189.1 alpha-1,2 glucosyltransferase [Loa loa]